MFAYLRRNEQRGSKGKSSRGGIGELTKRLVVQDLKAHYKDYDFYSELHEIGTHGVLT